MKYRFMVGVTAVFLTTLLLTQSKVLAGALTMPPQGQSMMTAIPSVRDLSAFRMQLSCGNGIKEAWEQCDDGNRISGDGCSALCVTETSVLSSSSSSAPTATTCASSDQCGTSEYCTTETGDCQSTCAPGADVCPMVCMGVCKPKTVSSQAACAPVSCPSGYTYPTCTQGGHPINYFVDPCHFH